MMTDSINQVVDKAVDNMFFEEKIRKIVNQVIPIKYLYEIFLIYGKEKFLQECQKVISLLLNEEIDNILERSFLLNEPAKEDFSNISIEFSIKIMDGINVIYKDLAYLMQFSEEDHSRILSLINENKISANVVKILNELIRKERNND